MKKTTIFIFLAFWFNISSAGEYVKPQTPSELHKLFGEYFAQKDIPGLESLFDEKAVFVADENGNLIKGKKLIVKSLKSYMDAGTEIKTISASIHINGDTALIKSNWLIPKGNITGTALEVMKYKDGGWVYIIDNPNGY